MTGVERDTSRAHWALVASTTSVSPSSRTVVARSSAGPTTAVHAKRTLPGEIGVSRSRPRRAPRAASFNGSKGTGDFTLTGCSLRTSGSQGFGQQSAYDRSVRSNDLRLILASASPRRAELLTAAGYVFETLPVDLEERAHAGETPAAYVRRLAGEKSAAALERLKPTPDARPVVVLGADTTVVVDGQILGKPQDDEEARAMLRRLSGRDHQVMTGISLRTPSAETGKVEQTTVCFAELTTADVDWYIQTGEGCDKAGGYAIQGFASRFISRIDGSYSNVVGLPVEAVARLLEGLSQKPTFPPRLASS